MSKILVYDSKYHIGFKNLNLPALIPTVDGSLIKAPYYKTAVLRGAALRYYLTC